MSKNIYKDKIRILPGMFRKREKGKGHKKRVRNEKERKGREIHKIKEPNVNLGAETCTCNAGAQRKTCN
jgi:hypothetical protein